MELKQKAIDYWIDKIKNLQPKKGVTDLTKPEIKKRLNREYKENLSFIESRPLDWFEKFERLANIQTTYASCGGHTKAARNRSARVKEEDILNCDIPSDYFLYSFGRFNGTGAV